MYKNTFKTSKDKMNELAEKYINIYNTRDDYEHYRIESDILDKLFTKDYPQNSSYEQVQVKVKLLNLLYGTNILAYNQVAKHIVELNDIENLDNEVKNGNKHIIESIANIVITNEKKGSTTDKRFYSFATKYSAKHQPKLYPIYDKNVEYILLKYQKEEKFSNFKKSDLREYPKFKKAIDDFRKIYGLEKYDYKTLDNFLWTYGKEERKMM